MNNISSVNKITQPKIMTKLKHFSILSNSKLMIYPKEGNSFSIQDLNSGKLRDKNVINNNNNYTQKFKFQPTKFLNHK